MPGTTVAQWDLVGMMVNDEFCLIAQLGIVCLLYKESQGLLRFV